MTMSLGIKEKDSFIRWRNKVLEEAKILVIKVGSAILTTETGPDLRVVNRLADQISALHDSGKEIILVSSGAVAAGRNYLQLGQTELSLPEKQAAAAIGQSRLMHSYDEAFQRYNKTTAQILLTRDDLRSRYRFLNARNTFSTLLANQVIPIVNENDTVVVQELKFGDNDFLATLILNLVQADLFINLTTAQGVYDKNPDLCPTAKRFDYLTCSKEIDFKDMCQGKSSQGAGGMYSKLMAAQRASQLGLPTLIVSGRIPFVLEKVFSGEDLGTWVIPEEKSIPQRKFWLAYNLDPAGSVVLDKGAQEALLKHGSSLLPAGIKEVRGAFSLGDLVEILSSDNIQLGVGLSNFDSIELQKIAGKKSSQLSKILGYEVCHPEAIHRDNLLLEVVH